MLSPGGTGSGPPRSDRESPTRTALRRAAPRWQIQRGGLELLLGIVALMWLVEIINWIDGYGLRQDGIYARSVSHLWGIFTSPFIHENFAPHLVDNTIPFVFMGVIIAWRGAVRLATVTVIVIVLGGLGTWLIGPANASTIGASGVVFGYATYLLTRGLFDRSLLELLTGGVVGVIWGGALLSSLVPHRYISWQGHLCGALAGVIAAWYLAYRDGKLRGRRPGSASARRPSVEPAAR